MPSRIWCRCGRMHAWPRFSRVARSLFEPLALGCPTSLGTHHTIWLVALAGLVQYDYEFLCGSGCLSARALTYRWALGQCRIGACVLTVVTCDRYRCISDRTVWVSRAVKYVYTAPHSRVRWIQCYKPHPSWDLLHRNQAVRTRGPAESEVRGFLSGCSPMIQ